MGARGGAGSEILRRGAFSVRAEDEFNARYSTGGKTRLWPESALRAVQEELEALARSVAWALLRRRYVRGVPLGTAACLREGAV